jgi:hypothetical protein
VSAEAATKPILTLADLAERWGCSGETAIRRVRDPSTPIPAIIIGAKPKSDKRARLTLRFRLQDVERWEANQARILSAGDDQAATEKARLMATRPPGYDGEIHTKTMIGRKKRP